MDILIEDSILCNLLIACLAVGGWNYSTRKGKILGFVRNWKLPDKLKSWLYGCLVCSSSWIGTAYYFIIMNFDISFYPFWVLSLAGMCAIYEALINKLYRP